MTKERSGVRTKNHLKVNFFGLGGVGKTTIIHRLLTGRFNTGINYNLKADFYQLLIIREKKKYSALLWDFTEVPQNLPVAKIIYSSFFKNCKLAFCVLSLIDRESLIFLQDTIEHVKQEVEKIILIGNKSDLKKSREVSLEEVEEFTNKHKINYIEISALDGSNFNQIEDKIIEIIKKSN